MSKWSEIAVEFGVIVFTDLDSGLVDVNSPIDILVRGGGGGASKKEIYCCKELALLLVVPQNFNTFFFSQVCRLIVEIRKNNVGFPGVLI